MISIYPTALALAVALAAHGYRKGSLDKSGSLAALIVGYITMGNPLATFGILLIGFYLAGSRATKIKAEKKASLERESTSRKTSGKESTSPHKASSGGQRDALQVLCNSFTAAIAALLYRLLYSGETDPFRVIESLDPLLNSVGKRLSKSIMNTYTSSLVSNEIADVRCPLDSHTGSQLPRFLLLLAVGHFSCCMGDTLASELGILAKNQPVLVINPFRKVPAGTNGGVSAFGTLCSLLGGTFIGLLTATSLSFSSSCLSIASLTLRCSSLILLSSFSGFFGSMLDSILGATLQRTWYSKKTKQVLLGRLPTPKDLKERKEREEQKWTVVTGVDVLSNNQVNFISSFCTALITAWIGTLV